MLAVSQTVPPAIWTFPFVAFLLSVAILPLVPKTAHWWEHNRNKLILGLVFGAITLAYAWQRGFGTTLHDATVVRVFDWLGWQHETVERHVHGGPGLPAAIGMLAKAAMEDLPFIILLFSLYTIFRGVARRGGLPAHPATETPLLPPP